MWVGPDPLHPGSDSAFLIDGTSFASPFVAGIAALVWTANPALPNATVWALLQKHANAGQGINMVNAYGPVREALMSTGQSFAPKILLKSPTPPAQVSQPNPMLLSVATFDVEDGESCGWAKATGRSACSSSGRWSSTRTTARPRWPT